MEKMNMKMKMRVMCTRGSPMKRSGTRTTTTTNKAMVMKTMITAVAILIRSVSVIMSVVAIWKRIMQ